MADWRQIQARIRKARASSNPPAQLAELYDRTRDAMVAFELAQWHEKNAQFGDAARWYTTAAERFRRAQWRTKAAEALARLGAPVPAAAAEGVSESVATAAVRELPPPEAEGVVSGLKEGAEEVETVQMAMQGEEPAAPVAPGAEPGGRKRRRRGRRGGRGRRRRGSAPPAERPAEAAIVEGVPARPAEGLAATAPATAVSRPAEWVSAAESFPLRERGPEPAPAWQPRSRAGEPAIASRIALLESQLRRLLACPMVPLDRAEEAPAGPGVLLLSDSDQTTHYYVEACQTLRIAIGNLLRGGRGGKEAGRLRARMAESLGIAESRVSKYLRDHCGVRWLQLDEGASPLAHFAIAVLRPIVVE